MITTVCVCVCTLVGKRNHVQHDGAFTRFCVLNQSEKKNVTKTEVVSIVSVYFKSVLK